MTGSNEDFEWPCSRRVAHGPHPLPQDEVIISPEEARFDCPGVKAHPHTQIGRGDLARRGPDEAAAD